MSFLTLALLAVPAQEPAALHPADAAVLLQVPDVGALLAAYDDTTYGRILADPDLHAAIGRVQQLPDPVDPRVLIRDLWAQEVESGNAPPFDQIVGALDAVSFSMSVPGGDIAAMVAALESSDDPVAYMAANMTVRAVLDFEGPEGAAAMLAAIQQGMDEGGQAYTLAEGPMPGGDFGPDPLVRMSLTDAPDVLAESVRFLAGGRRMVMLMGAESDADALLRMVDGEPDAAARLAAGRSSFSGGDGTVVFEAALNPFIEQVLMAQEPMAVPLLDIAEGLLGPLASMVIRGGQWRVRIVDGQFVTDGHHARSEASPLAGLFGAKPLDSADLALVRPDAILAWAVSMDKNVLMRLFQGAMEQQGDDAAAQLDELEQAFGFRPDRDLIAPLGDALAYSLPPLGALLSAPPFMVSVDVEDLDAFTRGMDGVFSFLEAQAGNEVQLAREEYKGVRTYTLTFPNAGGGGGDFGGLPINPSTLFKPTIAIGQGRAFVTTLRSHARKEIRRVDKLKGELVLHPTLTADALPEGATEVGYADWAEFFGKLYSGVKGLAPMLGAMGGELPFDLAALPDGEIFTRHFRPSSRWKRRDAAGVQVWARSPFGPEAPLMLVGAGAGAVFQTVAPVATFDQGEFGAEPWEELEPITGEIEAVPAPPPAPAADQVRVTEDALRSVRVDIEVYRFDNSALPSSLEALGADLPADGWGRGLRYAVHGDTYHLWSMGPNGIDDQRAGDDVQLVQ